MDINVFLAVIIAALIHALWNGMVKNHKDKHTAVAAIVLGHVPASIVIILIAPLPAIDCIPYIIASAIIHQGYQWFLLSAYNLGDYTIVYPTARGTGPVIVTIVSIFFLGVTLTAFELIGILLISFGILSLSFTGKKSLKDKKALLFAIWTGFFIGGYSLIDGAGARISGSPLSFMGFSFILNALMFPTLLSFFNKPNITKKVFKDALGLFWIGGTASYIVYGIVVWAFTKAPIPLVSALREVSVILALIIGSILLKEKLTLYKVTSILIIFSGIVFLKFF